MNIINGGAHADSASTCRSSYRPDRCPPSPRPCAGAPVYHALKAVLKAEGLATGLGDEGGFAPSLGSNRAALDLIATAVEKAG